MTDIVDRLRSSAVFITATDMPSPVAREAADEIERLREALRRIGAGNGCMMAASHPPICSRAFAARAALGEAKP